MSKVKILLVKELGAFYRNPFGYIAIGLFGLFANFLFIKDLFIRDNASMRPFFEITLWILILFVPAFSMRMFAAEIRSKTFEVLLSLPISEKGIVLAKYMALVIVGFVALLTTVTIPITLFFIAKLYLPVIVVSYFGLFLVMSVFIAISLFFSSLTSNQIISFLSAVIVLFLTVVIGSEFMSGMIPRVVAQQLVFFSPMYHLDLFLKGVIDMKSVFFLLFANLPLKIFVNFRL
jgi:ABC-2 type transport system permease protein